MGDADRSQYSNEVTEFSEIGRTTACGHPGTQFQPTLSRVQRHGLLTPAGNLDPVARRGGPATGVRRRI